MTRIDPTLYGNDADTDDKVNPADFPPNPSKGDRFVREKVFTYDPNVNEDGGLVVPMDERFDAEGTIWECVDAGEPPYRAPAWRRIGTTKRRGNIIWFRIQNLVGGYMGQKKLTKNDGKTLKVKTGLGPIRDGDDYLLKDAPNGTPRQIRPVGDMERIDRIPVDPNKRPYRWDGNNLNTAAGQAATASTTDIGITTSTDRDAMFPIPLLGQFIFLTDTASLQRWDGSAWVAAITTVPTAAPTGLSASTASTTAVISFSAGADGGSEITNYEYALSTDGGSTYGAYSALSPADGISPITLTGFNSGVTYYVKLKAVNALGAGSSESTPLSFTTTFPAPTSLAGTALSTTSISISFTQPTVSGLTNYQYALSTDGGSTYGSYAALSPADSTSPITISGLSSATTYHVKLRGVGAGGVTGTESSAVSVTTNSPTPTTIEYLVVAGGGGGTGGGGGAGAGGFRTSVSGATSGGGASAEAALSVSASTQYAVVVGAGGAGTQFDQNGTHGASGNNSSLASITSIGGGYAGSYGGSGGRSDAASGGSGGGGGTYGSSANTSPGSGTSGQGYGGGGGSTSVNGGGGGGGGAASSGGGGSGSSSGNGGSGQASSISGTSVTYAGGGGGGGTFASQGSGGSGGGGDGGPASGGSGSPGVANTGGGGGGGKYGTGNVLTNWGGDGGSGVVIIRYPSNLAQLASIGAGLTYTTTTSGGYRIYTFTAGSGNISW